MALYGQKKYESNRPECEQNPTPTLFWCDSNLLFQESHIHETGIFFFNVIFLLTKTVPLNKYDTLHILGH